MAVKERKVLVVDDDPDIVESLREVLESAGYVVQSTTEGHRAVGLAKSFKPDLIILDVMMEEPDAGFEIAKKLGGKTPIIMLTSIAGAAAQTFDTSQLPIRNLVDKPVAPDVLLQKVARLLA